MTRRLLFPVLNEGPAPISVRLEPIGLEETVAPDHAIYVIASGPPDGSLEVEQNATQVMLYAWAGSQLAFEPVPEIVVDADPEAFGARLAGLFASIEASPAMFAALVAERFAPQLGEDADLRVGGASATPREMIAATWTALDAALPEATLDAYVATLRELSALVDPDRVQAPDVWRALGVVEEALRCCAGAKRGSPLEAARACLAARALVSARDPARSAKIAAAWAWESVQREARWLAFTASALAKLPVIDAVAADTLRRAFARPAQPSPPPSPMPAAWGVPKSRPPPAALAAPRPPPPSPPPRVSPEPSTAKPALEGPRLLELGVAGRRVKLIRLENDARYRAEVDGERRPIRVRFEQAWNVATWPRDQLPWTLDTAVHIEPLLACLAEGGETTELVKDTLIRSSEQWGHYRQNRYTSIVFTIGDDGILEIDMTILTEDGSYY